MLVKSVRVVFPVLSHVLLLQNLLLPPLFNLHVYFKRGGEWGWEETPQYFK